MDYRRIKLLENSAEHSIKEHKSQRSILSKGSQRDEDGVSYDEEDQEDMLLTHKLKTITKAQN